MGNRINYPLGCAFFQISLMFMLVSQHTIYQMKAEYLNYSMAPVI